MLGTEMRAQLVGENVSIMVINSRGKPTMMLIPREEALKLGEGLLALFGIGNPLVFPPRG